MYGFLRDVEVFAVNLFRWFLSEAIARQTGIRDCIGGEKVIQGFLAPPPHRHPGAAALRNGARGTASTTTVVFPAQSAS